MFFFTERRTKKEKSLIPFMKQVQHSIKEGNLRETNPFLTYVPLGYNHSFLPRNRVKTNNIIEYHNNVLSCCSRKNEEMKFLIIWSLATSSVRCYFPKHVSICSVIGCYSDITGCQWSVTRCLLGALMGGDGGQFYSI